MLSILYVCIYNNNFTVAANGGPKRGWETVNARFDVVVCWAKARKGEDGTIMHEIQGNAHTQALIHYFVCKLPTIYNFIRTSSSKEVNVHTAYFFVLRYIFQKFVLPE